MMKYITLFIVTIVTIFASNLDTYSFKYEYHNPSLGPIDGYKSALVTIKNGKIDSILNLKNGKKYKSAKKFPIASLVFTILKNTNTEYKNYTVKYDKNAIPTRIDSKDGGFYVIVKDFKKVSKNKTLTKKDFFKERFKYNLKKWEKSKIKSYKFNYKFSNDKKHTDGIMVTVRNGKIFQAIDEFSQRRLKVNKATLNIDKLFKIVEYLINKNRLREITYDPLYGYPTYIKYHSKHKISNNIIISQFIKLKR